MPHLTIPQTMHSDADADVSFVDPADQRSSTLDFDSDRPSEPPSSSTMHGDAEVDELLVDTAEPIAEPATDPAGDPAAGPSNVGTFRKRAKTKLSFPTEDDEDRLLARHRSRPDDLSEMRQYTKKMQEEAEITKKTDAIISANVGKLVEKIRAGIDETVRAQNALSFFKTRMEEDAIKFSELEATMQSHIAKL